MINKCCSSKLINSSHVQEMFYLIGKNITFFKNRMWQVKPCDAVFHTSAMCLTTQGIVGILPF